MADCAQNTSGRDIRLNELWGCLVEGTARIVDAVVSREKGVLVLRMLARPEPPLSPRTIRVLERLLCGDSQKVCASDVGVAASTITVTAKHGLREIGVDCLPSRAPLLLAVLAHAARDTPPASCAKLRDFWNDGTRFAVVEVPPSEVLLSPALSGAERDVAALLLEGKPYREIAEQRRTSVRTVANQVTSVFHRLKVSGRGELMARVVRSLSNVPAPHDSAVSPLSAP
jgi:DNA-binding NarL/FixJ family response regulator